MNLQKGLVGHWTMNSVDTEAGVVRDSTARSNDAVINGATSDHLGRIATGFSFSGNGEDLVGPDIPATRSNPFTATTWVLIPDEFPSNVSGNMSPIAVRTNANTKWSVHYRNPNNDDSRQFEIFTENNGSIRTGDTFSEQKWHFIAVIDDGTDLKLRVNNTVYTDSGGGGTTFSSGGSEPFRIGATRQGKESWQGNIDDVRYYNRVLSNRELDTLYNIRSDRSYGSPYVPQRPVAAGDLVAWYPFEAGDAVDATAFQTWAEDNTDYSGTVNGATQQQSGGVTDIRRGSSSSRYNFDGTANIETFNHGLSSHSISCWFRTDTLNYNDGGDNALIFGYYDGGGAKYTIINMNGSNFNCRIDGGGGGAGSYKLIGSSSVNTNQWYHAVLTYNSSTSAAEAYLNGSSVGSISYLLDIVFDTGSYYIGGNPVNGTNFNGQIDDCRIYNKPLSQDEVEQIYANTKP